MFKRQPSQSADETESDEDPGIQETESPDADPNHRSGVYAELAALVSGVDRLRSRLLSHDETKLTELGIIVDNLSETLDELKLRLNSLGRYTEKSFNHLLPQSDRLSTQLNDVLDGIADVPKRTAALLHELLQHAAALSGSGDQSGGSVRVAAHALIAAYDQLTLVYESVDSHSEVIDGQRRNLEATLRQLGVLPIAPSPGSALDPIRLRSESGTIPAPDRASHERVARVVAVGWEMADGSTLVRPAQVQVYRWDPTAQPTEPVKFGESGLVQAEPPDIETASTPRTERPPDDCSPESAKIGPDEPRASDVGEQAAAVQQQSASSLPVGDELEASAEPSDSAGSESPPEPVL